MSANDKPGDKPGEENSAIKWAAASVGIGSAAIVAALLYVNHAKKKPTPPPIGKRWSDD